MLLAFREKLAKRSQLGTLRELKQRSPYLCDLTSSDYLGFARSPVLRRTIWEAYSQEYDNHELRLGATGSRLLTGNSEEAVELENFIATTYNADKALIYNCGYMANLGLLTAIAQENDTIIYDSEIHASTKDGIKLSKARSFPFRHQDLGHLEKRLRKISPGSFVCIESVYSMSGDIAPLEEICALCEQFGHYLIVDEAHGLGIIGEKGEGLVSARQLESKVFARVLTFGKAPGVHGAAVLGSSLLCEYLVNFSRAFVYTTALPYYSLVTIGCSLRALSKAHKERAHLLELTKYFHERACQFGNIKQTGTPICPVIIPGVDKVQQASSALLDAGIDVRAILSPTVNQGKEQLRIVLHAFNQKAQIDALFDVLALIEK